MKKISSVLGPVTFSIALAGMASAFAADIDIAPSKSAPAGQTYGRWAAEWWQWAEGVPAAENPVTDKTGQYCTQRQVGDVWFLAGFFGSDQVVRNCEVPAGKSVPVPCISPHRA